MIESHTRQGTVYQNPAILVLGGTYTYMQNNVASSKGFRIFVTSNKTFLSYEEIPWQSIFFIFCSGIFKTDWIMWSWLFHLVALDAWTLFSSSNNSEAWIYLQTWDTSFDILTIIFLKLLSDLSNASLTPTVNIKHNIFCEKELGVLLHHQCPHHHCQWRAPLHYLSPLMKRTLGHQSWMPFPCLWHYHL